MGGLRNKIWVFFYTTIVVQGSETLSVMTQKIEICSKLDLL